MNLITTSPSRQLQDASTREIRSILRAELVREGAGVQNFVAIGGSRLPDLDPFLVWAEFGGERPEDFAGGFPAHPHRGFETCTYVVEGRLWHEDSAGHGGWLGPGSVQWMSAARGLVHAEMPDPHGGVFRAFQLWINLPASDKLKAPRYQDVAPERIPTFTHDGVRGRLLVGRLFGLASPVETGTTEPLYLDLEFSAGAALEVPLPPTQVAAVFVYEGQARVAGREVPARSVAVLSAGDRVALAAGTGPTRLLLLAGTPIGEPVAKGGPFVMNTPEEIEQAFVDYHAGRLGR